MRPVALPILVLVTLAANVGTLEAQRPGLFGASMDQRPRNDGAGFTFLGGSSMPVRILTAVGAAAIGAGVGYFASQVVRGDWEQGVDGSIHRPTWAAVGGSIGFAVGFSFPLRGRSRVAEAAPGLQRSRFLIAGQEIEELSVQTAYEVVRLLRPEWLNDRGPHVFGEGEDDTIQVYQDGIHLGGVSWLEQIQADHVRSLRFLDAAEATLRFGAGNSHGAILVVTGIRTALDTGSGKTGGG